MPRLNIGTARFIYSGNNGEQPRRVVKSPTIVHTEYPEHVIRSCAAIRMRRIRETEISLPNGEYVKPEYVQ